MQLPDLASRSFVPAMLLALAICAPPARAQCGPDGLDGGPCCAPTNAILPAFPSLTTDSLFLCYDNCATSLSKSYCAILGPPIPMTTTTGTVLCGVYNIRIRLVDCATGVGFWTGGVKAFYSRNWQESSVAGVVDLNVWRFVVSGDFSPTPLVPPNPCERPGCLSNYNRIYFSGHIDYALNCATGNWNVAFALSHECDGIHHAPGTARPAPAIGLHPTRSFSIVGPGSTFVPSVTVSQSNGPITQEAIRWNRWIAAAPSCFFEERAQGLFQAQNAFCSCVTASTSPQYVSTLVQATGSCGTTIGPSASGGFFQKRLGGWTNPAQFPGTEIVLFDFGFLLTVDGCTGTTSNEWYEGSETLKGFPAFDFFGVPLGSQFEDLGSSNLSTTSAAVFIGAPHVSDVILNFNLP